MTERRKKKGAAVVNRKAFGGCYAQCTNGTYCNPKTGF